MSFLFDMPLQKALFLERPNRFLIRCRLLGEGSLQAGELATGEGVKMVEGEVVEAHLADPGRLKELLIPGCTVWLRSSAHVKRKTHWSAVLCEAVDCGLVSLDTTLPNRLIARELAAGEMEEFAGWSLVRPEFAMGHSRWDFLLTHSDGRHLLLEVKSVTLVQGKVGFFPDAVTARGTRHVRELSEVTQRESWEAAVLFVVQREDATAIQAAREIDPHFADALAEAKRAGVRLLGRKCHVTLGGVSLGEQVPVM